MTDLELAEQVLQTWDFGDPAGSRARFEQAAAAEPDRVRQQVLLTQVARTHGLENAFDAGHAVLDRIGPADGLADEPATRSALERGRLHNSAGTPQLAVPLFRQAYDRATAAGLSGLAADAAHMLAIALPPEQREEWALRGIALAESDAARPDPLARTMLAALLNNLGWSWAEADRWADALPLFERAVELRRDRGVPGPLHFARWSRARALRALGRYAEALAEQRELAESPQGKDDDYVAEEIAANEAALTGQP
jgi:tetratricopeptide (TPR) repeat protein